MNSINKKYTYTDHKLYAYKSRGGSLVPKSPKNSFSAPYDRKIPIQNERFFSFLMKKIAIGFIGRR